MPRVPSSAARFALALSVVLGLFGAGAALAGPMAGSINFTMGGRRLAGVWNLSDAQVGARGDTVSNPVRQPALGVELAFAPPSWPLQIAVDVLYSSDDGVRSERENLLFDIPDTDLLRRLSVLEIGVGVRRAWTIKGFSPYAGAGGSWIRANLVAELIDPAQGRWGERLDSIEARESAIGYWVGGGIYRRLGPRFQLGITGRYSKAKMTFRQLGEVRGEQGGYVFVPYIRQGPFGPEWTEPAPRKLDVGGRHLGLVLGWSFPARK